MLHSKVSYVRSPFFYVGDKFKLLPQIQPLLPEKYERVIEPFVGGGSFFLNFLNTDVMINDVSTHVIAIHRALQSHKQDIPSLLEKLLGIIREYGLICSYAGDQIPNKIKKEFPKTYFAHLNKIAFNRLKLDYNNSENRDVFKLYVLMIYGFNRMLRFNKEGQYNIPVGNVDFNSNVASALLAYGERTKNIKIESSSEDFEKFMRSIIYTKHDLVYVDPPYLITSSEYNKVWNEGSESRLYSMMDELNEAGTKFAVSNVLLYGSEKNLFLEKWMKKYKVNIINSNYINYFDNKKKAIEEVLVRNYE